MQFGVKFQKAHEETKAYQDAVYRPGKYVEYVSDIPENFYILNKKYIRNSGNVRLEGRSDHIFLGNVAV